VHSPHIRTIRERIAIDGEKIPEVDYAGLAAQDSAVMQQALEGSFGSLSHFEVLTALAFKYFQRNKVQQASILTKFKDGHHDILEDPAALGTRSE